MSGPQTHFWEYSKKLEVPAQSFDPGALYASSVAVAEVNGDGKLDLLDANQCTSGRSWWSWPGRSRAMGIGGCRFCCNAGANG